MKDVAKILRENLALAEEAHASANPTLALGHYKRIVDLVGPSDEVIAKMGVTWLVLGKIEEANQSFGWCYARGYRDLDFLINYSHSLNTIGMYEKAYEVGRAATALGSSDSSAWVNLGNAYRGLKRLDDSAACFEIALKLSPSNIVYRYNLALIQMETSNYLAALHHLDKCNKAKPGIYEIQNNLSACYLRLERYDEALIHAQLAVKSNPNGKEAQKHLGDALLGKKQYSAAIDAYYGVLRLEPKSPHVWRSLGQAQFYQGEMTKALDSFNLAREYGADDADTLIDRSRILNELRRHAEALIDAENAVKISPTSSVAWNNLGVAYSNLDRHSEAVASLERSISINPDRASAWNDLGVAQNRVGQIDEALNSINQAIKLDPTFSEAHYNKSQILLSQGRYLEGWRLYEWRWTSRGFPDKPRRYKQPLWQGETDLFGKNIFIYGEQGFGDNIQFCRYVSKLSKLGATVTFQVLPPLVKLMASIEGVDKVISTSDPIPDFHFHCPVMSLPLAFKTTLESIPADVPYLSVLEEDREKWLKALKNISQKPSIGISWKGNPNQANDKNRSMNLGDMTPILDTQHHWVCLQKELTSDERNDLENRGVTVVSDRFQSFYDTAALISTLDLVITVDTSIAHLSGALNKPVWVLLTRYADFRYLDHRSDNPWYPTMTQFRQVKKGDWSGPIRETRARLKDYFIL